MMLQQGGPWALLVVGLGGLSSVTVLVIGVLHILKKPAPALLAVAPMGLAAMVVLGARSAAMSGIPNALAMAAPETRMSLVAAYTSQHIGIHLAFSLALTLPCVIAVLLSAIASLRSKTRGLGLPALAIAVTLVATISPFISLLLGYSEPSSIGRVGLYLLLGIGCAVALIGKDPAARQAGLVAAASLSIVVLTGEVYALTADTISAFSAIAAAPGEIKGMAGHQALTMLNRAHTIATPALIAVMLLSVASLWRSMNTPREATVATGSVICVAACLAVALEPMGAFTWLLGTL